MKKMHILGFASLLLLAGCSHYSENLSSLDKEMSAPATQTAAVINPQDIAPAAGAASELPRYLAREYYDMARYENDKAYDYKSSKAFTAKAMIAAKGQIVVPSKVSSYDIPGEWVPELSAARSELIASLKQQNTPDNAQALARAQARYECWLERAEEADDAAHYETCKTEFEQSMAMLIAPAAGTPATVYTINFAENSGIIDPASATTVDVIAQFLNDPKNVSYTATLTGFENPTAGMIEARVGAVRDALVAKGVAAERLTPMVSPMSESSGAKVDVALVAGDASVSTPYGSTTQKYVPVTPRTVQ